MGLLRNVRAGIRLATFQRVTVTDFRVSADQVALLSALAVALALVCGFALTEPPRRFQLTALQNQGFLFAVIVCFSYVVAREVERPSLIATLLVVSLSPALLWWVGFTGMSLVVQSWRESAIDIAQAIYFALSIPWLLAVSCRAVRLVCGLGRIRVLALVSVFVAVDVYLFDAPSLASFWVSDRRSDHSSAPSPAPEIDAESVFYAQHDLVGERISELRRGRPGVTDLYFVGFAADGTQGVFRREIEFSRRLFDTRFDTEGRSIALINHVETADDVPIASRSNLAAVLTAVGERMDVDEDVLFLFLTGHGLRRHELSVRFPPLPLNRIDPAELSEMLDAARIRWRVVVVSACYSGGFLDALRNDESLVMSSAAADRKSFGCSNDAEFTYFGRAFFREQLSNELSFLGAFEKARQRIHEWEKDEEKTPSMPQVASAPAILEKLAALEGRLRRLAEAEDAG